MMFRLVVDSLTDLPAHVNLPRAYARVFVDGKDHAEKKELTTGDVERAFREKKKLSTAGVPVGEWVSAITSLPNDLPILVTTFSSKLTGGYKAALAAKRLLERRGYEIHVFDTLSGSIGCGVIAMEALKLAEKEDIKDAVTALEDIRERTRVYLVATDLLALYRSGRVPALKAILGTLLGITPILTLENGEIVVHKKTRGIDDVVNYFVDVCGSDYALLGETPSSKEIVDRAEQGLKDRGVRTDRTEVSPTVTVHVGPGSFGIAFIEE